MRLEYRLHPVGGRYFRVSQTTLAGGRFSQAIESVTPEAISAHAFSVAARCACSSLEAPAVRHACRP